MNDNQSPCARDELLPGSAPDEITDETSTCPLQRPAKKPTRASFNRVKPVGCGRAQGIIRLAQPEPNRIEPPKAKPSVCRACGAQREPRHTYYPNCAAVRKKHCDRQRQKRRYEKSKNSHAFVSELT